MSDKLKEIEILTPEQLAGFKDETKGHIVFLTENTSPKDLAELNPLVSELLSIKENVSKLKMLPIGEDGKYDKGNIQSFIDAKQKIKKYRAKVKSTAKDLKANPAKKQKAIIAIEKSFIELATEEFDNAETVFKEYVDYEVQKKAEAQAKKDKAFQDQVDEANKAAVEVQKQADKTKAINDIKYVKINEEITAEVSRLITQANEKTLRDKLEDLNTLGFGSITQGIDLVLIEEPILNELRTSFATAVFNATELVEDKLKAIENQKKLDAQEFKNVEEAAAKIDEIIPQTDAPVPPTQRMPLPPTENGSLNELRELRYMHNDIIVFLKSLKQTEKITSLLTQYESIKF